MSETDPSVRSLIDALLATYVIALDRDDIDVCVQLFVPDGEFHVYGRVFSGHDGLTAMMTAAPRGLHLAGSALVDVDGNTATVRQQLLFIDAVSHEMRLSSYDDTVEEHGDRWLFRTRRCRFITPDGLQDRPTSSKGVR